ncbi:MAG: hypothetical protein CME71_04150 [Halobacteriovorax sp.]|nr:hypothetical protein [Halobacteriovorax sp.]
MKKFAIATTALTLIVVIGLFIKRNENGEIKPRPFPDQEMKKEASQALEQAQQALDKVAPQATESAPVIEPVTAEEEGMVLSEDQMIKLEAYFEKVEKDWSDRMNQLFVRELGLEAKVLQEYWKMRDGYEQDKLDAFEDFHEEMIEKYGESYTYKPSEEEQLFAAKVREKYDEALLKLVGQDNYMKIVEVRDQFNRELSEVDDKELGFIKVDF